MHRFSIKTFTQHTTSTRSDTKKKREKEKKPDSFPVSLK